MDKKPNKIFELANLFLDNMPDRHILRWCPEDYGPTVTDDHKVNCWNEIVDIFEMFPQEDIDELHDKYVVGSGDAKAWVHAELDMEEKLLEQIESALVAAASGPVLVKVNLASGAVTKLDMDNLEEKDQAYVDSV